jgi:hypothetical protein
VYSLNQQNNYSPNEQSNSPNPVTLTWENINVASELGGHNLNITKNCQKGQSKGKKILKNGKIYIKKNI